jgi:NADH-quinone oxidoreductase subunit J
MTCLAASALDVLGSLLSVAAGVGAIAGALAVVTAPRAFRAVMGLLVTIVCLSIEYVLLAAPVIAFIQILVYAGAVVVLFLFVVMLLDLGKAGSEARGRGPVSWEWAVGGTAALFTISVCGIYYLAKLPAPAAQAVSEATPAGVEAVGVTLFRDYLVSFEAAALFLLAAVVAAIYVAHPRERGEKGDPGEPDPTAETGGEPAIAGPSGAAPAGKEAS